jgi:hypothetical protein
MSMRDWKGEILRRVRTTHLELEEVVAQIPPEQMTQPGVNGEWTVKDVLAHITWWERHLLLRLRTGLDDVFTPGVDPYLAMRAVNVEIFVANRERRLDHVLATFEATYRELLAVLEALPVEQAAQDEVYDAIGADTFSHYPVHTKMLREWLTMPMSTYA